MIYVDFRGIGSFPQERICSVVPVAVLGIIALRLILLRDGNVLDLLMIPEHPLGAYTVTIRIAAIAYAPKSVTVFLVWHAAVLESAFLRCSKTCYDGRILSNRGGSLRCVGAFSVYCELQTARVSLLPLLSSLTHSQTHSLTD